MAVQVDESEWPLERGEVERLWREVCVEREYDDEEVGVRLVDESEMAVLNEQYRGKAGATNVLTFSYGEGEHDVAVCLAVAEREANERGVSMRDYVALLLVHAFLHATGMDHEQSSEEEEEMRQCERRVLGRAGFRQDFL